MGGMSAALLLAALLPLTASDDRVGAVSVDVPPSWHQLSRGELYVELDVVRPDDPEAVVTVLVEGFVGGAESPSLVGRLTWRGDGELERFQATTADTRVAPGVRLPALVAQRIGIHVDRASGEWWVSLGDFPVLDEPALTIADAELHTLTVRVDGADDPRAGVAPDATADVRPHPWEQEPIEPVEVGGYLASALVYADAMLERGRDDAGKAETPLFAAMINPYAWTVASWAPAVEGLDPAERDWRGADPLAHQALYELLDELTALTADEKYATAADEAVGWFFQNARSKTTNLLAWGDRMTWDLEADAPAWSTATAEHELSRRWRQWERTYRVAPEAGLAYARGLWRNQIHDAESGAFSTRAGYLERATSAGDANPAHAAAYLDAWSFAFTRTEEPERQLEMLRAIAILLHRFETDESFAAHRPADALELAIGLWDAAARVEPAGQQDLANRLRGLADRIDHTVVGCWSADEREEFGLLLERAADSEDAEARVTSAWQVRSSGSCTHADLALRSLERAEQLRDARGREEVAGAYRDVALGAADEYRVVLLEHASSARADALASAIQLLVHAHGLTDDDAYLAHADELGDHALRHFFGRGPWPSATGAGEHYEAAAGSAALPLALLHLHLAKTR